MDKCCSVPVPCDYNDSAACCDPSQHTCCYEPVYSGVDSTAKQAVSEHTPSRDELLAIVEAQNKKITELNELLKDRRTALAEAQHRLHLCGTFMTSFKEMATSIINNA